MRSFDNTRAHAGEAGLAGSARGRNPNLILGQRLSRYDKRLPLVPLQMCLNPWWCQASHWDMRSLTKLSSDKWG